MAALTVSVDLGSRYESQESNGVCSVIGASAFTVRVSWFAGRVSCVVGRGSRVAGPGSCAVLRSYPVASPGAWWMLNVLGAFIYSRGSSFPSGVSRHGGCGTFWVRCLGLPEGPDPSVLWASGMFFFCVCVDLGLLEARRTGTRHRVYIYIFIYFSFTHRVCLCESAVCIANMPMMGGKKKRKI